MDVSLLTRLGKERKEKVLTHPIFSESMQLYIWNCLSSMTTVFGSNGVVEFLTCSVDSV